MIFCFSCYFFPLSDYVVEHDQDQGTFRPSCLETLISFFLSHEWQTRLLLPFAVVYNSSIQIAHTHTFRYFFLCLLSFVYFQIIIAFLHSIYEPKHHSNSRNSQTIIEPLGTRRRIRIKSAPCFARAVLAVKTRSRSLRHAGNTPCSMSHY